MFKTEPSYANELQSTVRVLFPDCDPFGHLNNARYIDYFQNARTDHLEKDYGFHVIPDGEVSNMTWVSTKNQIAYLQPANLMEDVTIKTKLISYNNRVLMVEGLMFDAAETHLKAVIWMEYFVVDIKTLRPTTHEPELMEFFAKVCWSDETIDLQNFDERVKVLRKEYRKVRPELA